MYKNPKYEGISSQRYGIPGYTITDNEHRYMGFVPKHGHLRETPAVLADGTELPHECLDLDDAIEYLLKHSPRSDPPQIKNSDILLDTI